MPIYDMQCQTCQKVVEVITLNVNDELPISCGCGGSLKKVFDGNFGFKMSGECNASDGYTYRYMDCKAGTDSKVPCVHGRKTIDKKLKQIRMVDEE
jgi:putative FmdB family regulatory protein